MRRLGGPVAEDPLRLPAVAGEEVVDLWETFRVGEVVGVVDEGVWRVGDQPCWREPVACDLRHGFFGARSSVLWFKLKWVEA